MQQEQKQATGVDQPFDFSKEWYELSLTEKVKFSKYMNQPMITFSDTLFLEACWTNYHYKHVNNL